jgi:alpha-glucosidase
MSSISGVPFPFNASKMPDLMASLNINAWLDSLINHYHVDGTLDKVKSLIDEAVNFRKARNVKIFCGEWGVYIPHSDNNDRVYWYEIVRKYFDENNIPWTIWDYQGGFGLFKANTSGMFDNDLNIPLLKALGLNVPLQKQTSSCSRMTLKCTKQSFWWAGIIDNGYLMPLKPGYKAETENNNYNNQIQPLLLSNNGEVIWCNDPLSVHYTSDSIIVKSKTENIIYTKAGENLREAYLYASKTYFPPSGKTPDRLLFSNPQYNTWIELMFDQNQKDIMRYANAIFKNGMPAGVLMIDDNWQEDYGKLNFHPGRFPSPKLMIDSLHAMGFKVMLWICPFISPDCDVYRYLEKNNLLLKDCAGNTAIIRWWNGASGLLDFTSPGAVKWFKEQLNKMVDEYHVDGFKFDAGDFHFYRDVVSSEKVPQTEHTELYAKIGLDYPLNEYRAMWKMGGQPLANRLCDKNHSWSDLQKLVPNMILEGLMGYTFCCPDMIGGGEFKSFLDNATIDQDLIVRSAQCHALMPMMQFSVAPWRVLDKPHFDAVLKAVKLREKLKDYIMKTVQESAVTGEPILRSMEYMFPHSGYELIKDQFLIGDALLVSPVVEKNATKRVVAVPKGVWKSEDGRVINGPRMVEVNADIDNLPYFIKVK